MLSASNAMSQPADAAACQASDRSLRCCTGRLIKRIVPQRHPETKHNRHAPPSSAIIRGLTEFVEAAKMRRE